MWGLAVWVLSFFVVRSAAAYRQWWMPLVPALVLVFYFAPGSVDRRKRAYAAAAAWLAYMAWETYLQFGAGCAAAAQGACNIRLDALLIWPVLAILTYGAVRPGGFTGKP